jgi:hypothetical protein
VGPSFERVRAWAVEGIPFKIACQGIDQYFVRYYAKGPKRRPVQIDFCDADVRDAFDAWRRAVGVRLPGTEPAENEAIRKQRHSLPEHLNRVLERLTALLAGAGAVADSRRALLESIANEISSFSDLPGPIRGDTRARVSARLVELDAEMLQAARADADASTLQALRQEAADQLAPFRERMTDEVYNAAIEGAVGRILRQREQLPMIAYE